ncbi:gas vesicle protein GvpG [Prauserella muralis]|uniref:Gas vesicle protein G n=1 Tax=Prauserella muralis TaxID=588067 RepID=A0A2V4AGS4_9PSEU|nr:gas vesicle protein GvpG [Prauserella muralis]PXY19059.1 gas vesicle protein G [Prauserella muralis]TWE28956.1 gas vesicle protein GvpG [Prauserella muralis]
MGLLSLVFGLPLAPVRGVIALAEVIQERVDSELHDASSVRRDLEAAEQARAAGEISPEEERRVQQEAMERMAAPPADSAPGEE